MTNININHGAGGRAMQDFVAQKIVTKLQNGILEVLDDAARIEMPKTAGRLAMTTDSFVVSPLFFAGGDIGTLAIAGTVNDLTTSGAQVLGLSLAFILEDGVSYEVLDRIIDSIATSAKTAGVKIITGDTKVVEKGKGDCIYINTAGIGFIPEGRDISSHNAKTGDGVFITGAIGNHEVALMKARQMIDFKIKVESDARPLNQDIEKILQNYPSKIHAMKDPTRGGLAGAVLEIAAHSKKEILIQEEALPLDEEVRAVCDLAGLDPLYLSNEGKMLIVHEMSILDDLKKVFPQGALIGEVCEGKKYSAVLETIGGGKRQITYLETSQLPRIC